MKLKTSQRLDALRNTMSEAQVAAIYIPSSDPHLSEYLPEYWQGRAWLSGFHGSAGSLLITDSFAGLWTDSRYWTQAYSDLKGSGFVLMKAGAPEIPGPIDWVRENLAPGSVISMDGQLMSLAQLDAWHDLKQHGWVIDDSMDLLNTIWLDRPALPNQPVYEHKAPFAQRSRQENIRQLRDSMRSLGANWHLLSSLDDIAWLFNLRGADVSYNPVFLAHALVSLDEVRLYVSLAKIDQALSEALRDEGIQLRNYTDLAADLRQLNAEQTLLVDPQRVTAGTLGMAPHVKTIRAANPTQLAKALKTEGEVNHIRAAMRTDGAALCEFLAWFDAHVNQQAITELDVDRRLIEARSRGEGFVSPSFGTIAAFGPNGAMPHYQATIESHSQIEGNGLLLIDSGGQYLGGTTDITRVIPVGRVSEQEKHDYTLVLKGMIALSCARFPEGVTGQQLDVLARQPLWDAGLEFGHGTGHGVGYFLNVHEGPQSISWRGRGGPGVPMQVGMVTSNEPGLYRDGKWGIRIENLIVVVPAEETEFGRFLKFETLTLCPIDTRCILKELLTASEINWLNTYHDQVRESLAPLVQGDTLQWLTHRTAHID
ncbi:aminopeptidase P family protein [Paenalcaligenes niemegkensis]|uniref:aminopeptidase P family protein n=1 Tax=Paenalcaligenes niemegkensis TaxID=2895469 RepID=UPI002150D29B|nr:aminopeptidase P family protein [Paenalcaligenes niemegkensis]MCQ9616861.1 aminopeptidase P family protein [Paenalcaligenes niemegkensis]